MLTSAFDPRSAEAPMGYPRRGRAHAPVAMWINGAESMSALVDEPTDEIAKVHPPRSMEQGRNDLVGSPVELRWRGRGGVVHATGTFRSCTADAPWLVALDRAADRVDERALRRVGIRVDVTVHEFFGAESVSVDTRSNNLSLTGANLEYHTEPRLRVGDRVAVCIDPSEAGVLAGAGVVALPTASGGLRIRFDRIADPSLDKLVALINRRELRFIR